VKATPRRQVHGAAMPVRERVMKPVSRTRFSCRGSRSVRPARPGWSLPDGAEAGTSGFGFGRRPGRSCRIPLCRSHAPAGSLLPCRISPSPDRGQRSLLPLQLGPQSLGLIPGTGDRRPDQAFEPDRGHPQTFGLGIVPLDQVPQSSDQHRPVLLGQIHPDPEQCLRRSGESDSALRPIRSAALGHSPCPSMLPLPAGFPGPVWDPGDATARSCTGRVNSSERSVPRSGDRGRMGRGRPSSPGTEPAVMPSEIREAVDVFTGPGRLSGSIGPTCIGRGIHVEAGVPITLKESGHCK